MLQDITHEYHEYLSKYMPFVDEQSKSHKTYNTICTNRKNGLDWNLFHSTRTSKNYECFYILSAFPVMPNFQQNPVSVTNDTTRL